MDRSARTRPPGLRPALRLAAIYLAVLASTSLATGASAATAARREGEVLIRFRSGAPQRDVDAILADLGGAPLKRFHRIRTDHLRISRLGVDEAVARYRGHAAVDFIEPNYRVQAEEVVPDDPLFPQLWGLRNSGQTGGTPGADIHATAAWALATGAEEVLVGVIDTGVDYTHPDLAENVWRNTGEIPSNGVDDDRNGFVDDVFGYDFRNFDPDPMDDNGHGTHVAGTIGAQGNNAEGVAGVAWRVRILPLKFLGSNGSGFLDGAVAAIEYGVAMGARVLNNSWGGGPYSEALRQAIADAEAAGVLVVAAAGNSAHDNGVDPHYPSGYDLPNVVSVAASTEVDTLAAFSNFGATTVHLAAPGTAILSTFPGNQYGFSSGTSMSAPYVSGALALLVARFPALDAATARAVLFASVDPLPALAGRVSTGGRLNVARMLEGLDSIPPSPVADLAVADVGSNRVTVRFTAPGDDDGTGRAAAYDLRYAVTPLDEATFEAAARFPASPRPREAGSPEEITVGGLATLTPYYFALKARDEYGNESTLSNVASAVTLGPPDIAVEPASFAEALLTGTRAVRALRLRNVGQGTLDFSVAPEESPVPVAVHAYLPLGKADEDPRTGDPVIARSGGPDRFGYRWTDSEEAGGPPFEWVDIRSVGEPIPLAGDDETSGPVPIGFVFPFYGVDFTTVRVSTNGYLSFTSTASEFGNQPLPNMGAPENLIAAFWDDLVVDGGAGTIWRHFDGRRLIVQFQSVTRIGGGGPYTFEAILYPTGEIRFQYLEVGFPQTSATVGIQNGARDDGLTVAFNTGYVRPELAVRIAPTPRWLSVVPDHGVVPASESLDLDVTFDATGLFSGLHAASFRIRSNDPVETDVLVPAALQVTGAADVAVAPGALSFGTVYTGTERSLGLTVMNAGSERLDAAVTPPVSGAYSVDASPFALLPGERRTLQVRFAPPAGGVYVDTLGIHGNDPDEPEIRIPLLGEAVVPPEISVSPASFDEVLAAGATATRSLAIENQGPTELTFRILTEEGDPGAAPAADAATAQPAPPIDLAAWAAHRVTGPRPKRIVAATGTETALPIVVLDPTGDGGEVDVTSLRASTRSGALTVEMTFASVVNPYDFGGFLSLDLDQDPSTGAPPSFGNGRQVLGAEFEFLLWGVGQGYVTLIDRRTGRPAGNFAATYGENTIRFSAPLEALDGDDGRMDVTGVAGTFEVPMDWFPDQYHGTIGAVSWLSASPGEGTVPPGGRVDVALGVNAAGLLDGAYDARLRVDSNDPDEPRTRVPVHLRVVGIPDIDLSADTLRFGTLFAGYAGEGTIRVTNAGTGPLSVREVVSDRPVVFMVDSSPFDLRAGERIDLAVVFQPPSPGPWAGALHFLCDDPDEGDRVVTLLGEAVHQPEIDLDPSLLHADLLTGGTAMGSVTVRNSGLGELRLWSATRRGSFTPSGMLPSFVAGLPEGATRSADPRALGPRVMADAAAASNAPPRVLVVQNSLAWGLDFRQLLQEQFLLTADVVSAQALAGTDLERYDVIVTAGEENAEFYTALSAAAPQLARFVDAGGILQYDVATLGDNVFLAGGVQSVYASAETRNRVLLPHHPIVANVPLLLDGPYINHCVLVALPADARVITDTAISRRPTTAEYRIGRGTVIATGMTWEFLYLNGFPSAALLTQSLAYSMSLSRPSWLGISPGQAVIPPGGSADFAVEFDAAGLLGGDYTGAVEFESNDPDEPTVRAPASLHVTGAPDVAAAPESLDFGSVFVGGARADSIAIENRGSDLLHVNSIALDAPAFSLARAGGALPVTLPPGARLMLRVRFEPSATGPFMGAITLQTDDPDQPDLVLPVAGEGVPPPRARLEPDSLEARLATGGTARLSFTLANEGLSDLVAEIVSGRRTATPAAPAAPPRGRILVIQTALAWGVDVALAVEEATGVKPTSISPGLIGAVDFDAFDLILTAGSQDAGYYYAISTNAARFEEFAASGGVVGYLVATNASGVDLAGGVRMQYGARENTNRIVAPGHPVVAALPESLAAVPANNGRLSGLPASARVITETWGSRLPTTAEYALGAGRVIATAMPWEQQRGSPYNTAPVLTNALRYLWALARPGWLSVSPASARLAPGGRLDVEVSLDAAGMEAGGFAGEIDVATNDPLLPRRSVAVLLRVDGVPALETVPAGLDFGPVYVGTSRARAISVRNPGTGPLRVSGLSIDDPAYSIPPDGFELPPHSRRDMQVVFAPAEGRSAPATLRIEHDAAGSPGLMGIAGVGVPPPVLALPASPVAFELETDGTGDRTAEVRNAGGSDLEFTTEPLNGAPAVAIRESLPLGKGEADPRPGEVWAEGEGGPDRYGYRWVDSDQPNGPRFSWTDIRYFGVPIPITGDDAISPVQAVGFEFPFYGRRFTQFRVCTNGWISFTSGATDFANQPLPSPGAPGNLIAPFWADLVFAPGSSALRLYDGTRTIIQFTSVYHYAAGGPYTFQVILYPSGAILMEYLELRPPTGGETIGIQNADGTDGIMAVFNAPYVHDRMAIRFSPAPDWLAVTPAGGRVPAGGSAPLLLRADAAHLFPGEYAARVRFRTNDPFRAEADLPVSLRVRGAPRLAVSPASLDFDTVYVGQRVERSLTATNAGTAALTIAGVTVTRADFSAAPAALTLAPLESATLAVAFAPGAVGDRSAVLEIASDDPGSPARVPLAAWALVAPEAALSPERIEAALPPGGAAVRALSLENRGGSDLRFDAAADVPWMQILPPSAVAPPGGAAGIAARLDASGLGDGDHAGRITVTTNDPARPVLACDVLVHVGLREAAAADVDPGALNLDSRGRFVLARVELPEDLDPRAVVRSTVRFLGSVPAVQDTIVPADWNRNGVPDLEFRFDRTAVEEILPEGDSVVVVVTGEVRDRTWFAARDTVRTIRPRRHPPNGGEALMGGLAAAPPARHALHPAAPNPARSVTALAFDLPRPSGVRLRVFDARGRLVREVAAGTLPAGRHRRLWDGRTADGREAPSGIYFAQLTAGSFEASRRFLLLR